MNAPLVRCDVAPWSLWGISLAGWNFLFSARRRASPSASCCCGAGGQHERRPRSDAMLRVDQAGEYGATRIYAGQLAVMGTRAEGSGEIAAMAAQEAEHLDNSTR